MSRQKHRIIISGGGTGGHIFPAVAIADGLRSRLGEAEILFVGARGRMEMEKVPAAGYPIRGLWISGIRRKLSLRNLSFPFKLVSSMLKAHLIIREFGPDVAIGTGGYASGPLLRAASRRGIPSLIQEQNSYPGITNKILARSVDTICVAFEGMEKYFPAGKIVITGNPVRKDILSLEGKRVEGLAHFGLKEGMKTVLFVGGSQGARSINLALAGQLEVILKEDVQIIWQCGRPFLENARAAGSGLPGNMPERLKIHEFIQRMDLAYAVADVVVSRAGAIAISELCIAGKAAILVPLPSAAEDHQTRNAQALEEKDAAMLLRDRELGEKLQQMLGGLLSDSARQERMKKNIREMARPAATEEIVDEVIKLLER